MRAVDEQRADALETAGPDDVRERMGRQTESIDRRPPVHDAMQNLQRGEGRDGVLPVKRARQREIWRYLRIRGEVRRVEERRPLRTGGPADDFDDRRLVRRKDDRHAGLDDPGLFRRDPLDRVPQPVAVVKPDPRDDAELGTADVRRVEPSAGPSAADARNAASRIAQTAPLPFVPAT